MPVHVTVRVNEREEERIHIGRIDDLYSNTQTSRYLVVRGYDEDEVMIPYRTQGVEFTHKYDDGLLVCVEKGLAALREAESSQ